MGLGYSQSTAEPRHDRTNGPHAGSFSALESNEVHRGANAYLDPGPGFHFILLLLS